MFAGLHTATEPLQEPSEPLLHQPRSDAPAAPIDIASHSESDPLVDDIPLSDEPGPSTAPAPQPVIADDPSNYAYYAHKVADEAPATRAGLPSPSSSSGAAAALLPGPSTSHFPLPSVGKLDPLFAGLTTMPPPVATPPGVADHSGNAYAPYPVPAAEGQGYAPQREEVPLYGQPPVYANLMPQGYPGTPQQVRAWGEILWEISTFLNVF